MSENPLPILCTIDVDGVKALGIAAIPTAEFLSLTEIYLLNFDANLTMMIPYASEEFANDNLSGVYTVSDFVQIIADYNAQGDDPEITRRYTALFDFYEFKWIETAYEGFSQYFYPEEYIVLSDIPYTILPTD